MTRLSGISKSIKMYEAEHDKVPSMATTEDWTIASSNADPSVASDASDFWSDEAGCNLQAFYLLIIKADLSENSLHCPSDKPWVKATRASSEIGFSDWKNSSYAFQITDGGYGSAFGHGSQQGSVVVAADQATLTSGAPDIQKANANHGWEYINLLDVSGSVSKGSWEDKDDNDGNYNNFGYNGDDIYDNGDGTESTETPRANLPPDDSFLYNK